MNGKSTQSLIGWHVWLDWIRSISWAKFVMKTSKKKGAHIFPVSNVFVFKRLNASTNTNITFYVYLYLYLYIYIYDIYTYECWLWTRCETFESLLVHIKEIFSFCIFQTRKKAFNAENRHLLYKKRRRGLISGHSFWVSRVFFLLLFIIFSTWDFRVGFLRV